jgi:endonuclease G
MRILKKNNVLIVCFTILLTITQATATNWTISKENSLKVNELFSSKYCDQVISKQVLKICYDYEMKGAKYIEYRLIGSKVNYQNIKKRPKFYTERTLDKNKRSTYKDYTHSGYDRGHLAPDAAFDYDLKSLRKIYTMANIIPQNPKINRYYWIKVEKYAREQAKKLGFVNVLNGVIYNKNPKRIGKNRIAVPTAFWKMISNEKAGFKQCFMYYNHVSSNSGQDFLFDHEFPCNKIQF